MSDLFIDTPSGCIPLSKITRAKIKADNRYELFIDDQCVDNGNLGFGYVLAQLIPTTESWDFLFQSSENGNPTVTVHPIIAWGRKVTGEVVPITPVDLGGAEGHDYALRKMGEERVYVPYSGYYDNVEEWIADTIPLLAPRNAKY